MYKVVYQQRVEDEVTVARFATESEAQDWMETIKVERPKAYPHHKIEKE